MRFNAKSVVACSSSSARGRVTAAAALSTVSARILLVAEVHDCHLMGASQFRTVHEQTGPLPLILSRQLEMQVACLIYTLHIWNEPSVSVSENRNYR